ncbi:MAG: DUF2924 domain-containing protein [Parvularculaceae bacterium]
MTRRTDQDALEREIAALDDLAFSDLQQRYEMLMGGPPPKRIGRKLLVLAIAYEIQRKAYGVRIDRLTARVCAVRNDAPKKIPRSRIARKSVQSGGRLIREWRGKSYEVYIADDGCLLASKHYGSLSAVAEAITGVKRNGPAFFGLRSSRVSS